MLTNGVQYACSELKNTLGIALDNFNCKCPAGSVFRDFTFECVSCSSISNTDGSKTTASPYACNCASGYLWNILTFTCDPNTCTTPSCTYCSSKMAGVVAASQLIIRTSNEATVSMSGDSAFALQASTDSPLYNIFSNYKCVCGSNYVWDVSRRRCFLKSVNATY